MVRLTEGQRGHLAMLVFSALIAGSFSLGVQIANDVEPGALTAVRFVLAAAVVFALCLVRGLRFRGAWQAPWRYLVLGALFAGYFVLMFEGLKTAPPVSAAAVFTLTPAMAGVFGYFLIRQITTPRTALAIVIGAFGAVWVIFRADLAALLAFDIGRGEAIYFVGCIAHAAYAPLVPKLNRGEPAPVFTLGMILGALLILLVYGWGEIRATDWAALSVFTWLVIGYLAVFASAATFVLLQYAALRLPAAKVMAYTYLTPVWVIAWEIAQGHGVPPLLTLGGIVLIVVALLLLLKPDPEPVGS